MGRKHIVKTYGKTKMVKRDQHKILSIFGHVH